jgi:protein TonB
MNVRQIALWVGAAALMGAAGYAMHWYLGQPMKATKPRAQQISVLRQQPPPPPPKPQEKPPEPEMKKEEVKLPEPDPEPQQADDQPPPGEQLGVDSAGGAGTDGFGLVGKPGGRDITTIPEQTGGGGRAKYAYFTNMVQNHLQEELLRRDKLRQTDYRTVVKIWFTPQGTVDRVELVDGTGNDEIDRTLRSALLEVRPLRQPPPNDMPQPLKLRLSSRIAG